MSACHIFSVHRAAQIWAVLLGTLYLASSSAAQSSSDNPDSAWRPLEVLAEAGKYPFSKEGGGYFFPPHLDPRHEHWMKQANQLLREAGLDFVRKYPRDPRRWDWLVATTNYAVRPDEIDLSADVRAAWQAKYRELKSEMLNARDASDSQRLQVFVSDILWETVKYREQGDLQRWQTEILELAEKFPDVALEGDEVKLAAGFVLRMTQRARPDLAAAFIERLSKSRDTSLRNLGSSFDFLEQSKASSVEFRFTAIDGSVVDLAALRGKVVLIEFWGASWCGVCREELPILKTIYQKYRGQGFEIVGITIERGTDKLGYVRNYLRQNQIEWPQYFDGLGIKSPIAQRFGIISVPQYFLLSPDGKIVWDRKSGGGVSKLDQEVRRQLKLEPE
jgi:thiol-disulfide isomerase/thioredoxin